MKKYPYVFLLYLCVCFLSAMEAHSFDFNSNIKDASFGIRSAINSSDNIKVAVRWIVDEETESFGKYSCPQDQEKDSNGNCRKKCDSSHFPYINNKDAALTGCKISSCDSPNGKRYACSECDAEQGYERDHVNGGCFIKSECENYTLREEDIVENAGRHECITCGGKKMCRYTECDSAAGWFFNDQTNKCETNDCNKDGFIKGEISDIKCTKPAVCISGGTIYSRCDDCTDGYEPLGLKCGEKNKINCSDCECLDNRIKEIEAYIKGKKVETSETELDINGDGIINETDIVETVNKKEEAGCQEEDCGDFTLKSCPEGAICAYTECGGGRYKIDSCQNEYKLEDGSCQCHKELRISGELAGRYSCSMCHSEWGGNMCTLDVKMEKLCTTEDECTTQNYTGGGTRMYDIYFFLGFEAAEALGIDTDKLSQQVTLVTHEGGTGKPIYLKYGYRNGIDTQYEWYNNELYFTEKDCKIIGEKYFGEKNKGKEIDLPNGFSDKGCKTDCTGFDLDSCPENAKCSVCNNKFKVVGEMHENKGWKCYKINDEFDDNTGWLKESDECDCESYTNESKDGTYRTSKEKGCAADTYMCESLDKKKRVFSGVCGSCTQGYKKADQGKCEFIPCGADYWMATNNGGTGFIGEFTMSGCKKYTACFKHYGDDAYIGNQKWSENDPDWSMWGYGHGDMRDGCYPATNAQEYLKCEECETGYTEMNNACVADSGVGSIYKYNGKPVGIVFYEDADVMKVVSLENLGGVTNRYYTQASSSDGTAYYWEDAVNAAKNYAPSECGSGSICGKGKWHLPTKEEMELVSKEFSDAGPLLQAIRGLEASCSDENSMRLTTNRYWTSTETIINTNKESVYGGADIDGAFCVYHPIGSVGQNGCTTGKKNTIGAYMHYVRPVLTIKK